MKKISAARGLRGINVTSHLRGGRVTRTRRWPARTVGFGWLIVAAVCWSRATVLAQNAQPGPVVDLAGEWAAQVHEDAIYRGAGGFLGDYTGLPLNAASRQAAESWDADILSQPERQTQAHPAQYAMRGEGPNIRISEVREPVTDRLVALKIVGVFGR